MAELLNRTIQRQILDALHAKYPAPLYGYDLKGLTEARALGVNLAYLAEHGLIDARIRLAGTDVVVTDAKITARGIDFLADDGGLSAILGVQVVRLHDDTVRDLLEASILESDAEPSAKQALIDQVRRTPANMLGQVVEHALGAALRAAPNTVGLLQQALAG